MAHLESNYEGLINDFVDIVSRFAYELLCIDCIFILKPELSYLHIHLHFLIITHRSLDGFYIDLFESLGSHGVVLLSSIDLSYLFLEAGVLTH